MTLNNVTEINYKPQDLKTWGALAQIKMFFFYRCNKGIEHFCLWVWLHHHTVLIFKKEQLYTSTYKRPTTIYCSIKGTTLCMECMEWYTPLIKVSVEQQCHIRFSI